MNFDERLERAIQRGARSGDAKARAEQEQVLSEEQLKRLHSQYRLQISEHIEACLSKLPRHFPGFQLESVVSDRGWGAAVSRDDVAFAGPGRRGSAFSRLEMVVRPYSTARALDVSARGTIQNKEVFNRSHYQLLADLDPERFNELIDLWVIEYAEVYAASQV